MGRIRTLPASTKTYADLHRQALAKESVVAKASALLKNKDLPPHLRADTELVLGMVRALLNDNQALRQQVQAWDELHKMYEGHDPGAGVADLVDGVLS